MKSEDRVKYTIFWNGVEDIAHMLSNKMVPDSPFDVIIGIGNGGIVPAFLIRRFHSPKAFFQVITVRAYTQAREKLESPKVLYAEHNHLEAISGANVLVVDDIVDTGGTMDMLSKILEPAQPAIIVTAALFARRENQVDFYGRITDRWVEFPWEKDHRLLMGAG